MSPDSSTIFRFVTVRNPRKPTDKEIETGFIRYDTKIKSKLVQAYSTKSRKEALVATHDYKKSESFATNCAQIDERQSGLTAFADWLTTEADQLTQASLKKFQRTAKVKPKAGMLTWLWDNLATHVLVGGHPEVRESIIGALRAYKLLEYENLESLNVEELRRLASATVLMPNRREAKKKPAKDDGPKKPRKKATPGPETAKKVAAGVEKIARIQNASEEISRHLRAEIERSRSVKPKRVRVPHVREGCMEKVDDKEDAAAIPFEALLLSEKTLRRFSRDTQGVLREAGVESGVRLPYAIQRLQSEAGEVAREAFAGVKAERRVVQAGGAFWAAPNPASHMHEPPPWPPERSDVPYPDFFVNDRECKVYPLGVADYRRVEQRLYCYEPGEVAHIENVMQGETKERTTRNLRRTEETLTVSTQEETTKERDSQTTDRFEIEKEASKVVDTDMSFEIGVQIQASYGPVSITADTKFATSNSTTESDKQASKYGRDVTERALERVVRNVREERITKVLNEYEEINKHGLQGGDVHVVGLFRWVDKIYEARIVNYGKRLMFEFMVPEPGAFHLYAMIKDPIESSVTLLKPIDPRSPELLTEIGLEPLTSHLTINPLNYGFYAAAYGATVDPPPPEYVTISKAYHREGLDHNVQFADSKNDLALPAGYEAMSVVAPYGLHAETHDGGANWLSLVIGYAQDYGTTGKTLFGAMAGEDDIVPVIVMGRTRFYALNVEILCQRSQHAAEAWQMKAFSAILGSYETRLAAYNNELAEAKSRAGIEIQGTNPASNRQREQIELEKSCVRLLAQSCNPLWSEAMKDDQDCHYPEFDCCEAIRDGSYVQFLEQCFEWRLMTYLFYPYFWGRKCNWQKIYQLNDVDPLFLNFLQAGFAKVVVPVREGYNDAAKRFLADGTLWDGGSIPGVEDPMYIAMANEMKEPIGVVDPTIQPWKIRVPTTLTVLQCESGCVPGKGLPCPGPDTPWP